MTMKTHAKTMTYDDALEVFLSTRGSFGGGLSNHGPMATEALSHMGAPQWIGEFVTAYRPRLEARDPAPTGSGDWMSLLHGELPSLGPSAAAEAGHGLLRVAHAVRGIERAELDGCVPRPRVDELRAALRYWRADGSALPSPPAITGDRSPEDWLTELGRLATFDPLPGLLTATLDRAAHQEGFLDTVASLARAEDSGSTLDALALIAVDGYRRNDDFLSGFALLHGVTVSTMSRHLVGHVGKEDERRLVASVAGFVAAAVVGFDRPSDDERAVDAIADDPANRAAATLDDHTIKFTDACLGLAERTGSERPLLAIERQIRLTS